MSTDKKPPQLPLFRPEAVEAKRPQVFGEIILLPGARSGWAALVAVVLVAALLVLFFVGTYTRRSTVTGQLLPREGLIRVTVDEPGVIIETNVREGQDVTAGQVLMVVSGDRAGANAVGYQRDMAAQIEARRASLEGDTQRLALTEAQERAQIQRRMASLAEERQRVQQQALQLGVQVDLAAETAQRYRGLLEKGYVSRDELLEKEASLASLRVQREGAMREALVLQRESLTAQRELDGLRSRFALQRGEFDRAKLLASQEFKALEARRRVVVTAPTSGRITLLRAEVGQSVEPQRVLVNIVPVGDRLVARLQVPSRAIGFVKLGTPVQLRYDAFPYQKFGQQRGKVGAVSAAASQEPVAAAAANPEPVYEVTVELPSQTMNNDAALRLQAGMRVEADLLHETRTLVEWMVEPLLAARSRSTKG
jgi:membrane fusion protein